MSPNDRLSSLRHVAGGCVAALIATVACGGSRPPGDAVDPRVFVAPAPTDQPAPPDDVLGDVVERLRVNTCAVHQRVGVRAQADDAAVEAEVARLDQLSRALCRAGVDRVRVAWQADGTARIEAGERGRLVRGSTVVVLDDFDGWTTSGVVVDDDAPYEGSEPGCGAAVGEAPDFVVIPAGESGVLTRIVGQGVSLRVVRPDGEVLCVPGDGRSAEAVIPAGVGEYGLWVGAPAGGVSWRADLSPAETGGVGVRVWNFGEATELPVSVENRRVPAPVDDDVWCAGFIGETPDVTMFVPFDGSGSVSVRSDFDPVLVVRGPNGELLCNDDYDGYDPRIDSWFEAGAWDIYVGSYDEGAGFDAVLVVE